VPRDPARKHDRLKGIEQDREDGYDAGDQAGNLHCIEMRRG
jgi:hypothetical protein